MGSSGEAGVPIHHLEHYMSTPNSKKHSIAKLPKDWRARIFTAATPKIKKEHSKLALAVAALWSTGCRPVELEDPGIAFMMHGQKLVAIIKGGKHGMIDNGDGTSERGLDWRQFSIDPNLNAATQYLAAFCADGQTKWIKYKANTLRTRVNELGKQVMGNIKDPPSVSPYTFRHAMACDLKSCDSLTDEQRSQVMGHLALESLNSYGRRRRGGGGLSPVKAVRASATPHGSITKAPPAPQPSFSHLPR